jgi:methylmalonyl-CoA mutase
MLRLIEQGGGDPFAAAGSMGLMLAVDQDQFLSIAKLRAARQAHASFLRALKIAPRPLDLHAETAWRMMSRRDPHVNMLRATAAVFAAGAGGADHVTVLPFTLAIGLPDRFARRMARNVQTVLARESRIGAVSDAAAGSGYVETLTREIAEKAWGVFQSIERAGGLVAGLEAGTVKAMLAETAAARANDVARRKEAITGVSEFPNLAEVPAAVLDAPRRAPSGHGLTQHRVAEPFEALRDRADAASRRPAVFMAAMGRMADFTARAGFMQNLFAAGGIAAPVGEGFATTAEAAQAFAASGATAACLASSDTVYETLAVETVTALKAAGARTIVFAGRPGALEAALTGAGVTQFAFAGMDAVAFLDAILDAIPTEDRV